MSLEKLLQDNETAIVKRWFEVVIGTYPEDTRRFIQSQKDPFANPVGATTFSGLKALFDALVHGVERESATASLDPIIRIRAVQNFSPSIAVAFVADLKHVVQSMLRKQLRGDDMFNDWLRFEHRIDRLVLIAFDIYMGCREKIYQLKADNERTQVMRTFARAGLLTVEPERETDPAPGSEPPAATRR